MKEFYVMTHYHAIFRVSISPVKKDSHDMILLDLKLQDIYVKFNISLSCITQLCAFHIQLYNVLQVKIFVIKWLGFHECVSQKFYCNELIKNLWRNDVFLICLTKTIQSQIWLKRQLAYIITDCDKIMAKSLQCALSLSLSLFSSCRKFLN